MLRGSFLRRRRRKILAVLALALGIGVSTASLMVAVDIGDKVGRELRSFGANIIVVPKADTLPLEIGGVDLRPMSEGSFLREDELPNLKTIFWRHHILGFAPFLYQTAALPDGEQVVLVGTWFDHELSIGDGSSFVTGLPQVNENWEVEGVWPADGNQPEAVMGAALVERFGWQPGQEVEIRFSDGRAFRLVVTGQLATGGDEDRQILVPLHWLQQVTNHPGEFRRLQLSALVSPEDAFARQHPDSMTPADYDRWYCTPYVSSIALQVEEVLEGSDARAVRRVAQAETAILSRVERLLGLISFAALLGSGLAVLSTMTTTVLERRGEIALMKALGAANSLVGGVFLAEAVVLGLLGGLAGYFAGVEGADLIGQSVFGAAVEGKPALLPAMLALSCIVALVGVLLPLRQAERTNPALVLKER
jgi:putative ABC transport system permease protein